MSDARTPALVVLLLCAFAVNVDTTIVNVALPTLSTELDASTRDLQWIVDAYTLVFARSGSRPPARSATASAASEMLLVGLGIYVAGNGAAALVDTSDALIACRAVMGLGAAIIFPATLSTIVHLYSDRGERAKAIGLWGATTGIAVALGPIVGGALLEATRMAGGVLAQGAGRPRRGRCSRSRSCPDRAIRSGRRSTGWDSCSRPSASSRSSSRSSRRPSTAGSPPRTLVGFGLGARAARRLRRSSSAAPPTRCST